MLRGYPTLHTTFNEKEETGRREYRHHIRLGKPAGLRAKNGIQEETLKCWRKQQTSGRQSAMWIEPAPPQPRRRSPRTPSPTAVLRARFGLGCGARAAGEPPPNSSAAFRASRNQKPTSTRGGEKRKSTNTYKREAGRGHTRSTNNEREARGNRR